MATTQQAPSPLTYAGLAHRADQLLNATAPWWSPAGSLLSLPGVTSASGRLSDGLEGFARTFLLAAFRIRGARGDVAASLLEHYARGVSAGADPAHSERWPRLPEVRQARVEAASVAIALSETRPWIWDRLPDHTQQHVVGWLSDVIGTTDYSNNWLWFHVSIQRFLESVGGPSSAEDMARCAELAQSLYVGDGWYSDGRGRAGQAQAFDYYAGWAWHVYPLLTARIQGTPLPAVDATRLRKFLPQYAALLGDGRPVLQGRSVTYREAVLGPVWAGELAGAAPWSSGATRDLARAVLDSFPIDDDAPAHIGWRRPFLPLRQAYTGACSPYWLAKGYLGLLLGPGHELWRSEPERTWRAEPLTALPAPGWLLSATPDGLTRLVNHGSDKQQAPATSPRADDPSYLRLGYANEAGPTYAGSGVIDPLEQHVAILDDAGRGTHRERVERVAMTDGAAASASWTHWLDVGGEPKATVTGWAQMRRGPRLLLASFINGASEVRMALIGERENPDPGDAALWPASSGSDLLRFGGWALGSNELPHAERGSDRAGVWARGLESSVRVLAGDGAASGARRAEGVDAFGEHSAVPWVAVAAPPGRATWCEIVLRTAGSSSPTVTNVALERGIARVAWADGTSRELDLSAEVA